MNILKAIDVAVLFCKFWLSVTKDLFLSIGRIIILFFQLLLFFVIKNFLLAIIFYSINSLSNSLKKRSITEKLRVISIRMMSIVGLTLVIAGMIGLAIGKNEDKIYYSLIFSIVGFILISGCFYYKLILMNKREIDFSSKRGG